jgi:hypothetical protein
MEVISSDQETKCHSTERKRYKMSQGDTLKMSKGPVIKGPTWQEVISIGLGRWVAKLVVRLLATAALWVRIQTSLKNTEKSFPIGLDICSLSRHNFSSAHKYPIAWTTQPIKTR